MNVFCPQQEKSRIVDAVAPVLTALKEFLPSFREPDVVMLSSGTPRVMLTVLDPALEFQLIESMNRLIKAHAWRARIFEGGGKLQILMDLDR